MLKIVIVPDNILTTPVKPVIAFDNKLSDLIREMGETLNAQVNPQGVGLAATQIGVNLAIFIIKPTPDAKIESFINPVILKTIAKNPTSPVKKKRASRGKQPLEGCLSIPKVWGPVKRAKRVLLEYQTITGVKKTRWFSGFKAVIIQHEVDHLKGILFTQRVLEQHSPLYEEKDDQLEKLEY